MSDHAALEARNYGTPGRSKGQELLWKICLKSLFPFTSPSFGGHSYGRPTHLVDISFGRRTHLVDTDRLNALHQPKSNYEYTFLSLSKRRARRRSNALRVPRCCAPHGASSLEPPAGTSATGLGSEEALSTSTHFLHLYDMLDFHRTIGNKNKITSLVKPTYIAEEVSMSMK